MEPGVNEQGKNEHSVALAGVERRLSFVRGRHHWVFVWDAGGERELLKAIAEVADRPGMPLDRIDAAAAWLRISGLSFQYPQPAPGGSR